MYDSGFRLLPSTIGNLKIAAQLIHQGRLVVVPTSTIYVIACDAFNKQSLNAIRRICKSPYDKPLTTALTKEKIPQYAVLTPREKKIVDLLLPSPASLYLNKKDDSLDHAVTFSDAICAFCQESEITTLCELADTVIGITSANPNGMRDADTIFKAIEYFGNEVSLYLDGGSSRGNYPSAHIDIRTEPIQLVREAPHYPFKQVQQILHRNKLQ